MTKKKAKEKEDEEIEDQETIQEDDETAEETQPESSSQSSKAPSSNAGPTDPGVPGKAQTTDPLATENARDQYPAEITDPYFGMRVAYWHDPQTVVEAEIKNILRDGRVDLELISPLVVGGVNHGQSRLGVRHEYGSRTPGTWDYLFNTQLSYPKPQPVSVHASKDEVVQAGVVKDESGKSKVVETSTK